MKNQITQLVLAELEQRGVRVERSTFRVPAAVSARHVHLSQEDLYRLFGAGYELSVQKNISQPGQYAAEETVTLEGKKGASNVRYWTGKSGDPGGGFQNGYLYSGIDCLLKTPESFGDPGITIRSPKG